MKLKFFTYSYFLAAAFLLKYNYAAGQEKPLLKTGCESFIEIHGSSNVNQFQLINHNPKIVRLSDGVDNKNRYQLIEIAINQFESSNERMRDDFLELTNASEYPFITMAIEPRSLADCRKKKGLSDFKTRITIAGISNSYIVPCTIDTCESSGYLLKGNLEIKLTDFGIDPPQKFFGLVKVDNEVLIDYVFRFQTDDAIFRSPLREQTGLEIPQTDLFIPYNKISGRLDELPDKNQKIVLYCRSDRMSTIAAKTLANAGYLNLYNLKGGMKAWEAAGYQLIKTQPKKNKHEI